MPLKIRTAKPRYWVNYDRDGDSARFLVSPLTPEELNALLEKRRVYEWDRNQRFEKLDVYGFRVDKICAVILDWEGVTGEDGSQLPCDREHKVKLFQHEPELMDWLQEQAEAMARRREDEAEAARKNSTSGRKA